MLSKTSLYSGRLITVGALRLARVSQRHRCPCKKFRNNRKGLTEEVVLTFYGKQKGIKKDGPWRAKAQSMQRPCPKLVGPLSISPYTDLLEDHGPRLRPGFVFLASVELERIKVSMNDGDGRKLTCRGQVPPARSSPSPARATASTSRKGSA